MTPVVETDTLQPGSVTGSLEGVDDGIRIQRADVRSYYAT
jgi:hypothetical protein